MSQDIFNNIVPTTTSGTDLANYLNDFKDAVVSGFSGSSRPVNLQAGGYWIDTTSATTWLFKVYDGADDITIFSMNVSSNTAGISTADDFFTITKISADSVGPLVSLIKKRIASSGQVLSNDYIGTIEFKGTDNSGSAVIGARVRAVASDNFTAGTSGTDLIFEATVASSAALAEFMRLKDAKLGIGTSSPQATLHVQATVPVASPTFTAADTAILSQTSNSMLQLHAGASGGTLGVGFSVGSTRSDGALTYDTSGQALILSTGATERMRISSSLGVSIGSTTARSRQLTIEGTGTTGENIIRNSADTSGPDLVLAKTRSATTGGVTAVTSGDTLGTLRFSGADGTLFDNASAEILGAVDNTVSTGIVPGRMTFRTASSAGTMTERMRIDSNGNVGVGTSSPVNNPGYGGLTLNGTTGAEIDFQSNGTNAMSLWSNGSSTNLFESRNAPLMFGTNNTERVRISGAGNVGIGSNAPGTLLHLLSSAPRLTLEASGTGGAAILLGVDNAAGTIAASRFFIGQSTTSYLSIATSSSGNAGFVGIGTTTPSYKLEVAAGDIFTYRENASPTIAIGNYGTGSPQLRGIKAQGTKASPTAVASGDILLQVLSNGYDGSSYSNTNVYLTFQTEEAWTTTARGTRIQFATTPIGSNAESVRMTIKGSGNVGIGTTSPSAYLHVQRTTPAASPTWNAADTAILSQTSNSLLQMHAGATGGVVGLGFSVASTRSDGWLTYDTSAQALNIGTNGTEKFKVTSTGSIVCGAQSALGTTATDGFVYIPTVSGLPTGVPTSYTGKVAMQYDTSTNKLYVYNGGWKSVTLI